MHLTTKRYLKVKKVSEGPRGTKKSRSYLKVQEVPKGRRGTLRFKMYLKVQRYKKFQKVPKDPRCT